VTVLVRVSPPPSFTLSVALMVLARFRRRAALGVARSVRRAVPDDAAEPLPVAIVSALDPSFRRRAVAASMRRVAWALQAVGHRTSTPMPRPARALTPAPLASVNVGPTGVVAPGAATLSVARAVAPAGVAAPVAPAVVAPPEVGALSPPGLSTGVVGVDGVVGMVGVVGAVGVVTGGGGGGAGCEGRCRPS
jgi:hypothetical protein